MSRDGTQARRRRGGATLDPWPRRLRVRRSRPIGSRSCRRRRGSLHVPAEVPRWPRRVFVGDAKAGRSASCVHPAVPSVPWAMADPLPVASTPPQRMNKTYFGDCGGCSGSARCPCSWSGASTMLLYALALRPWPARLQPARRTDRHGAQSDSAGQAAYIVEHLNVTRTVWLAGGMHFLPEDRAGEFSAAVAGFVQALEVGARGGTADAGASVALTRAARPRAEVTTTTAASQPRLRSSPYTTQLGARRCGNREALCRRRRCSGPRAPARPRAWPFPIGQGTSTGAMSRTATVREHGRGGLLLFAPIPGSLALHLVRVV